MTTPSPGLIELRLNNVGQLFNTMDPSPFHERDLDHDAEEFILSWAREHGKNTELRIRIVLRQQEDISTSRHVIDSIHHYFETQATLSDRELKELFREGRISLLIGLAFVAATKTFSSFIPQEAVWAGFVSEGLNICGWVALWKPIEIHLYSWWPLRAHGKLLRRLSKCPVEVVFEP